MRVTQTLSTDCYPVTLTPGQSRLFLDFCAPGGTVGDFYASLGRDGQWQKQTEIPAHRGEVTKLLAAQNAGAGAAQALEALGSGAGTVVTGQQVALFGGPLFTPFKMATAAARARQGTASGRPHVCVFWLATEDHDFAEVNHADFPSRREVERLMYPDAPEVPKPVGGVQLGAAIVPLVERAAELMGPSEATDALLSAYRPGRTLAQAFADFYARVFAAQGLLVLDASGRDFHRLGATVLRAGIEQADELHAALLERNHKLEQAGYHAQVAVMEHSSLLFLVDEMSGARVALKRTPPSAAEPGGLWSTATHTGRAEKHYSTGDLLGILETEPERISPSALLRPVFQDYLLSTSLIVGGPAEIAYFAQSAVLYDRILGRQTASTPRFSATLIEPGAGELLRKYELTLDRVFEEHEESLAKLLADRAMPPEGRQRLVAAGKALDVELALLLDWMRAQDEGLGKSAETAASKMQYQMSRLRSLAENFQLQREASLRKHAQIISQALFPGGVMQERVHAAAYYFARYGLGLAETLSAHAETTAPGHTALWL
jgi:bacillithiol biosynthesis cysteine-adding enzyme BshC